MRLAWSHIIKSFGWMNCTPKVGQKNLTFGLELSRKNRHKVKLMSNYFFQIQQVRDTLKLKADVWGYSKSHYI
ncbi:hypothetical protein B7R59_09410 [Streptococcus pyogenes]|nr:hypothetical protein B7R59_09410 [Streptococcus pyogenes]QAX76413.1 hypothetical protein D8S76_06080 [Streptococcus pyogenes]QCK35692.1 hypothetical protein ETT67_05640 [Streptococcus pyogenes]